MKLYEYAVIYHPLATKDQNERGEKPKSVLLVPVTHVLAADEKEAMLLAARAIPETHLDKLAQIEVAIHPF